MWRRRSGSPGGLVTLIILVVTSLILFTVYAREGESGPLHTVQLGAAEVLRPLRSLTSTIVKPIDSLGATFGNIMDKNKAESSLKKEKIQNKELKAQNVDLEQENERLRQLVNGTKKPYKYAPLAQVVAPIGGQFTDRIIINVGSDDGVKPEQAVVVGKSTLVGRTTGRVTAHTAEVMLITDQNFEAGVRILPHSTGQKPNAEKTTAGETTSETTIPERTTTAPETTTPASEQPPTAEGLLETTSDGYLGVGLVDVSASVSQGDFVVTSGRAGDKKLLFPPGLLVGTVESVSSQDIDQYKKIVVTPAVQPDDLQEVRVITDW